MFPCLLLLQQGVFGILTLTTFTKNKRSMLVKLKTMSNCKQHGYFILFLRLSPLLELTEV